MSLRHNPHLYAAKTFAALPRLSLSRQILRLHGGTLTVRSEPGVETVFALRF